MKSTRGRLAVALLIAVGLLLVLTGAWVSSRDKTQAVRESGPELEAPSFSSVNPEEGASASVSQPSTTPTARSRRLKPGVPQWLSIETIGVNAPVDVGSRLLDGTQEVPESMHRTSWYGEGSQPGEPGNTVIVGHTWSNGNGVFDRLSRLKQGDEIVLYTSSGKQSYRVTSVGSIPLAKFSHHAADIYRQAGPSGLVLMTCGDWNGSSYDATTAVYAEPIS